MRLLAWLESRGILVPPDGVLFVNVIVFSERLGVLGRASTLRLTFRFTFVFSEVKTLPSSISRSSKKSSLAVGVFRLVGGDWGLVVGSPVFVRVTLLFLRLSSKLNGPSGKTNPSRMSSSVSAVRQLEALGLNAETDEL